MTSEQRLTLKDIKSRTEDKEMDLSMMSISKVPVKEMAAVPKATSIDLSCNKISALPESFCSTLYYIVKLDLSKNHLTKLPNDFSRMLQLQHLDLYQNQLRLLPIGFAELPKLRWLDVKDNDFSSDFLNITGDCLDDKQCRKCAQNVVRFMKSVVIQKKQEERKQLELEQEAAAAKRKEEEKRKKEIKQQKLLEKQRKRKEWEAQQAEKRSMLNCDEEEDVFLENEVHHDSKVNTSQNKRGSIFTRLLSIAVLVVAVLIGAHLFCKESDTEHCLSFNAAVQNLHEELENFSSAANIVYLDYKAHLTKVAQPVVAYVTNQASHLYTVAQESYQNLMS